MAYTSAKQGEHLVQGCTLTSPVEDPVSEQLEMIQQRVIANLIVLQSNGRCSALQKMGRSSIQILCTLWP